MLGRIISTIIILGVLLAFWQMSGGNTEEFFATLWQILYTGISFIANLFTIAWETVFTSI